MIINSSPLTFMDTTDTKKIDVHISSNYPTTQIYDSNTNKFTPNWEVSGGSLRLTATVHADSIDVSTLSATTYQWFKDSTSGTPLSTTRNLAIRENVLENSTTGMITYICKVNYNNKDYENSIAFTLVTTGKNGVDGLPGKDGVDGQDGKSVGIKGVAYTNETFVAGATVTLYSDPEYKNKITTGGDADTVDGYLVDGYLCVYTGENFIWTGKIQGPKGNDGESTYLFTRYADDPNGNGFSNSPIGKKYIGFYRHSEKTLPSTVGTGYSDWTWVKYVGEDAKNISLNATTQVFRVNKEGKVSPSALTITPQAVNTSITEWYYGRNGGTFSTTPPAGVVRGSDGKITITGASMTDNSISVRVGDGTYSDTLTIYKAYDGDKGEDASIVFLTNENITFAADSDGQVAGITVNCDVVAYTGTTPVVPTVSEIFSGDIPDGMSLGERTTTSEQAVRIPIIITDNATLGSAQNTHGEIVIPIITPIRTDLRLTWSKVNSGAKGEAGVGISSVTVTYGVSTSASTQPTSWQSSVPTVADGSYLWTRTITDYTDNTVPDTVTYTYAKQGDKGDKGSTGSSVTVSKIEYQSGTSATIAPTSTWSNSVVSVAEGSYLWTKTTFSDNKIAYGVAKQGQKGDKGDKGDTGRGVSKITEYYLATADSSDITTSTSGWTTTIQSIDTTKKYLWNYELITYTDNTTSSTTPVIIGVFGNTGATGKGISSVAERYLATASSSGVTTSTTGWTPEIQTLTATKKYLWNYEIITYTDGTTSTINPVIIGVYGDKGDQGIQGPKGNDSYTVILTNESHIFAGDVSNAIVGTAETQVLAYNGSTQQSVTIISVNGKTATTTDTDTGITGLKFKCSALSGTSPKITFTCTTSFVSKSGSIPIVLSVGGVQFTKMFTYSIAFKGTTGTPGNPGSPGTPASLVDITPSALYFKSTTGKDGVFTPDYIYLYPRFQTVSYSKWEYSTNGGTTWVTASGANGLSIGTYSSVANTLRIAKTSTLYTDTITSISFRCVSSNTSVYDTVSIAKIYDVVDLQIGGTNLLPQSKMDQQPTTWYQNNAFVMVTEDGYNCAKLTSGIGTSKTPYVSIFDKLDTINLAQEYTISAWVKVVNYVAGTTNPYLALYIDGKKTSDNSWMGATNVKGNGSLSAYNNQGWKKIEWTIKFAELFSEMKFFVYSRDCTGDLFIRNIKMEKGNKASDWSPAPEDLNNITFQIYAPNGHLLTNELQSLTLQTFAYEGSIEITSGATFQWSQLIDNTWTAISGATSTTLAVTESDVLRAKSYRCVMTYKSKEYVSTITVQDKTDTYNSIMCISSNTKGSGCYWVLYTLVYSDTGEVDPLLGPISINAPTSPVNGDYWYAVDGTNATVQLKKYNGTSWANSTDKQSLTYLWNIVDNGSLKTPIGGANKVQVISCHDFTATATLTCDVSNEADGVLTQSSLSITDASDPIVSTTEPTNAVDGQIWIKPNTNGAYNMFLWSESAKTWIPSDMDTRNKVYTTKPSSYNKGDIWITESDTAHSKYKEGTLLQASKDSAAYSENDWSTTLKYDKDIDAIQTTLKGLSEYVTITSEGLRIGAVNSNGELSPFTSLFTSTELSFYQNSEKLLTLANSQLTAPRVVIEEDLEVQGSISLGGLQFTIENNGSFSLAVTK